MASSVGGRGEKPPRIDTSLERPSAEQLINLVDCLYAIGDLQQEYDQLVGLGKKERKILEKKISKEKKQLKRKVKQLFNQEGLTKRQWQRLQKEIDNIKAGSIYGRVAPLSAEPPAVSPRPDSALSQGAISTTTTTSSSEPSSSDPSHGDSELESPPVPSRSSVGEKIIYETPTPLPPFTSEKGIYVSLQPSKQDFLLHKVNTLTKGHFILSKEEKSLRDQVLFSLLLDPTGGEEEVNLQALAHQTDQEIQEKVEASLQQATQSRKTPLSEESLLKVKEEILYLLEDLAMFYGIEPLYEQMGKGDYAQIDEGDSPPLTPPNEH